MTKTKFDRLAEDVTLTDSPQAHWRYGCALAFQGRWEEAWPEMEYRFKGHSPSIRRRARFAAKDWDGKDTAHLLIYQDQGFGDLFQYVRYLPHLQCEYTLEVTGDVYKILKAQNFNVVMRGDRLPEYDSVSAASSLPYHLNKIVSEPYIVPPKNRFPLKDGKKIGMAWAGNFDYYYNRQRSCQPEEFQTLAECGELVSLMVRPTPIPVTDFHLKLIDFHDTAGLIDAMDCVVTVDTAVAHLAGAMGKKTYLVLPYEHDWRWGLNATTQWYPSMELCRQPEPGDWKSVFKLLKAKL